MGFFRKEGQDKVQCFHLSKGFRNVVGFCGASVAAEHGGQSGVIQAADGAKEISQRGWVFIEAAVDGVYEREIIAVFGLNAQSVHMAVLHCVADPAAAIAVEKGFAEIGAISSAITLSSVWENS